MSEQFFHHNGLFRSLFSVHIMLSKNRPVCVEPKKYKEELLI